MHTRRWLVSWGACAWAAIGLLVTACAPAAPAGPGGAPAKPAARPADQTASDERAVADFYRGKTVRVVVGFAPGGGYDAYSRLIARHVGKHIPGNPNVIVENMPGAGSMIAVNQAYNAAPKDGTVIVNFSVGMAARQLLRAPGVEFDAARFHYLGVPTRDTSVCIVTRASGLRSLAETIGPGGKQLVAGGDAPGSPLDDEPAILREALGANIRVISGYAGTSRVRLAMDQGEVEGMCGWSLESLRTSSMDRVESGDYVIISQNTEKAHKDLPNVPVAYEMARTEEGRQLFHYGLTLISNVQRQYAVPPGVPAARVQALRDAFAKALADPELLADAEKAQLNIEPVSGEEAQRLVVELLSAPPDVKAKLEKLWQQ